MFQTFINDMGQLILVFPVLHDSNNLDYCYIGEGFGLVDEVTNQISVEETEAGCYG